MSNLIYLNNYRPNPRQRETESLGEAAARLLARLNANGLGGDTKHGSHPIPNEIHLAPFAHLGDTREVAPIPGYETATKEPEYGVVRVQPIWL